MNVVMGLGLLIAVWLVVAVLNRDELVRLLGLPTASPEPVVPWSPPAPSARPQAAPAGVRPLTVPCAVGDPRPVLRLGRRGGSLTAAPREVAARFADERFVLLSADPEHPLHAPVVDGLRASLPELLRLLPANGRRWLELREGALTLVRRGQPLSDQSERGLRLELFRIVRAIDVACGDRAPDRPRVVEAKAAVRCAFCHDDLGGDHQACVRCGTMVHAECHAELARCPTPGCAPRSARVAAA